MTIYASRTCESIALMTLLGLSGCLTSPGEEPSKMAAEAAPDPYALFRKAKEYESKGGASWMKDKATASKHYARYRALMEEVTALLPDKSTYRSEHILATVKYADCCWHLGDVDEAMKCYTNAYDRLVSDPSPQTDTSWREAALGLIAAQIVMGDASMANGEYKSAEDCFIVGRNVAKVWQDAAPSQPAGRERLCCALLKLVDACILQAKYNPAKAYLSEAEKIVNGGVDITGRLFYTKEGLIKSMEETRSQLLRLKAISDDDAPQVRADALHVLSVRAMQFQDMAIMYSYLKRSIALREPLLQKGTREIRTSQMVALSQCGLPASLLKRLDEARNLYASSVALAEELLAEKRESIVLSDVAQTLATWGMLEETEGNAEKAEELYGKALNTLEMLEKEGDVAERDRRALMFLRSRRGKPATPSKDRQNKAIDGD